MNVPLGFDTLKNHGLVCCTMPPPWSILHRERLFLGRRPPGMVTLRFSGYRRRSVMSLTLEQFGIDRLSPQERCELIDLIWDSLPPDAPFTPPDGHLRELERRIAAADANPAAAEPWAFVR